MSSTWRYTWLLLILLAASFLRLHDITEVPPGMTHDEADHGLDAWGVVQGERPLYFTVGYGREPLFDYSSAILSSFLGPNYLAGRLTAVFFSLLLVVGSYAWARRAFDEKTALLLMAGIAVAFWPVMTGRHALRTVTMPALFVLAAALFWRAQPGQRSAATLNGGSRRAFLLSLAPAGLLLGLTFYTYIPARVIWLLFPLLLLYLFVARAPSRRLLAQGTLLVLLLAGLIAAPLVSYLYTHPEAETRVGQLAEPLRLAREGNIEPLFDNIRSGLLTLTVSGDSQWRYNIAGRPFLTAPISWLFYLGLALALVWAIQGIRRREVARGAASFFALSWLLLGLAPVLATGAELSTTQAAAMQPVLYLFPALGLLALVQIGSRLAARPLPWLLPLLALTLYGFLLVNTTRAYFTQWATRPEVTVQYEANLVSLIRYLNQHDLPTTGEALAISTDAPNPVHDPATARLYSDAGLLAEDQQSVRWFDGRGSLLFPAGSDEKALLFTTPAPPNPALERYLAGGRRQWITPNSNGVDNQPFLLVTVDKSTLFEQTYPQFVHEIPGLSTELSTDRLLGGILNFVGYDLQTPTVAAGETLRLATLWQVQQRPERELLLFTHVVSAMGQPPLAQTVALDAPAAFWQAGDLLIQLHEIPLPADLAPGEYMLAVGAYYPPDPQARLTLEVDGQPAGDLIPLPTFTVIP